MTTSPSRGFESEPSATLELESLAADLQAATDVALAAVATATSACMAAKGFEYAQAPSDPGFDLVVSSKFWNFPAMADAEVTGYVIRNESLDRTVPEPDVDIRTEDALYGEPVGTWEVSEDSPLYPGAPVGGEVYDGCLPTAQTAIIGGGDPSQAFALTDFFYRLRAIDSEAALRVLASTGWTEREAAWSECMATKGFAFETITDAAGFAWPEPRPSDAELFAAQEDLNCRSEADLAGYADAAYDRILKAMLDSLAAELNEGRRVLREISDRAVANSPTD